MAKRYVTEANEVCRHPDSVKRESHAERIRRDYPEVLWGKWYWSVGSHDAIGGGFGCFFVDEQSIQKHSYSAPKGAGEKLSAYDGWLAGLKEGEVFDTREEALEDGRKKMPAIQKASDAREAEYAKKRRARNKA